MTQCAKCFFYASKRRLLSIQALYMSNICANHQTLVGKIRYVKKVKRSRRTNNDLEKKDS